MYRYPARRNPPPEPPRHEEFDRRLNNLLQDCMDSFPTGEDPFDVSVDAIGAPGPPNRLDKTDFF